MPGRVDRIGEDVQAEAQGINVVFRLPPNWPAPQSVEDVMPACRERAFCRDAPASEREDDHAANRPLRFMEVTCHR